MASPKYLEFKTALENASDSVTALKIQGKAFNAYICGSLSDEEYSALYYKTERILDGGKYSEMV